MNPTLPLSVLMLVGSAVFSILLPAQVPAHAASLSEYCREITSLSGRKQRIASLLVSHRQPWTLSIPHQYRTFKPDGGGIFNSGLCWWKSRFQRNMIYLARLSPEKSRPTRAEALKIIQTVARMDAPVEIPGYETVLDFTEAYQKDIIEELEAWQLKNSVRGIMRTVNPLRPTFYRTASNLFEQAQIAERMLQEHGSIPYLMLQLKGAAAHSWLVLQATPQYEEVITEYRPPFLPKTKKVLVGYRLIVEDPNDIVYYTDITRETQQVTAFHGLYDETKSFNQLDGEAPFPFYIDWLRDLDYLEEAIQTACKRSPQPSLYPKTANWGTYR